MEIKKVLEASLKSAQSSSLAYDREYAEKVLGPVLTDDSEVEPLTFQEVKSLLSDEPYNWPIDTEIINLVSKKIFFNKEKTELLS